MPRKLPPHVVKERSRHGKVRFYFRRGQGKRIRLPSPTDPAFGAAYAAALASTPVKTGIPKDRGTLAALIALYRRSPAFMALSKATRKQRDYFLYQIEERAGKAQAKAITRDDIIAGRERRGHTPAQARNFLDAVRGLFRWSVEAGHLARDPSEGIKNPRKSRSSEGFPVWTQADVDAYVARWPRGTREFQWLAVLLHTGLRRGDAVRLTSDMIADGWCTIETEKTGIPVTFRLHPDIQVSSGHLITGERGPLTKESFGNQFRAACRAAGVEKSAHGLRKLAATRAAEAGLTVAELEARFGWTGGTMASLYTKSASRRMLAMQAQAKMEGK
jgi:integrase